MKTNILLIAAMAVATTFGAAATFDKIPFSQPTYSENDPLGVAALTNVEAKVVTIDNAVSNISKQVTQLETKDLTQDIANEVKKQLTNNTDVVIGQVTGTSDDIGLVAKNKSIVMAVNRDIEEIEATEGSITFAADKIQLGAIDSIYVGNQTLQSLLGENAIEEIQVNGVKVQPTNKVVKLTIPSIEGLAVASEVESIYAKKTEIPDISNLASKSEIPSLENYALKTEIPSLDEYAKTNDIPSIVGLASETFVTNKLDGYIKKSDVSSAASTAIAGINEATTIEDIQVALTNFLHTLVITPAP